MDADQHHEMDTHEEFVVDRRMGLDRRSRLDPDNSEDLARRRGPGRRRTDWTKAAEEGELTDEQYLFVRAIDDFKRENHKSFPTWTDVLEVIRLLGYRKTVASSITAGNADDWTEAADAPHGVRDKPGHRGCDDTKRAA
jgi:hypothetical protein